MKDVNWQANLRFRLEDFIDTIVVDGAKPPEDCDAIAEMIANLREDYLLDPDPAEDGTTRDPEPANDWPAAR